MIIKIDTKVWITVPEKAKQLGISTQAVWNRISRNTLTSLYIESLNLTLVKR